MKDEGGGYYLRAVNDSVRTVYVYFGSGKYEQISGTPFYGNPVMALVVEYRSFSDVFLAI